MNITVTFPKKRIIVENNGGGGIPAETGDMLKSVYDPTGVDGDAFDMENMVEGETAKILSAAERENIEAAYSHSQEDHEQYNEVFSVIDVAAFPLAGAVGVIYIAEGTGFLYRWSGSGYVEIGRVLGETSDKAYRGDRGKTAYDHSQATHAPAGAEQNVQANWSEVSIASDAYIQNKPSIIVLGETSDKAYRGDRGKTAYDHSQVAHAPSNAQKNSDITKQEIEDKLTGPINSHSHAAAERGFALNIISTLFNPNDGQTVYIGSSGGVPTTTPDISAIYIRKSCTLKIAEINCLSRVDIGTNEAWSFYLRKNGTTDYLIATIASTNRSRIFSKIDFDISFISGDYLEIKIVNPTWVTNPTTVTIGGYLYFELP